MSSRSLCFILDLDEQIAFADALSDEFIAGAEGGVVFVHSAGAVAFALQKPLDDSRDIIGVLVESVSLHDAASPVFSCAAWVLSPKFGWSFGPCLSRNIHLIVFFGIRWIGIHITKEKRVVEPSFNGGGNIMANCPQSFQLVYMTLHFSNHRASVKVYSFKRCNTCKGFKTV